MLFRRNSQRRAGNTLRMKKIPFSLKIQCAVLILAVALGCGMPKSFLALRGLEQGTFYAYYAGTAPESSLRTVQNGAGSIVEGTLAEIAALPQEGVNGYTVKLPADFDWQEWFLQNEVTVVQTQEDFFSIAYCYTPRLKGHIVADGRAINLQLVVREDCVLLGTPVLLGSY